MFSQKEWNHNLIQAYSSLILMFYNWCGTFIIDIKISLQVLCQLDSDVDTYEHSISP